MVYRVTILHPRNFRTCSTTPVMTLVTHLSQHLAEAIQHVSYPSSEKLETVSPDSACGRPTDYVITVNSIVLLSNSLSLVIQVVLLLSIGAWADYGNWRYMYLHANLLLRCLTLNEDQTSLFSLQSLGLAQLLPGLVLKTLPGGKLVSFSLSLAVSFIVASQPHCEEMTHPVVISHQVCNDKLEGATTLSHLCEGCTHLLDCRISGPCSLSSRGQGICDTG